MLPLLQQLQDNHADIVGFIEDPVRTTPTPSPAPSKRFSGCISLSPSFFCTSLRLYGLSTTNEGQSCLGPV